MRKNKKELLKHLEEVIPDNAIVDIMIDVSKPIDNLSLYGKQTGQAIISSFTNEMDINLCCVYKT